MHKSTSLVANELGPNVYFHRLLGCKAIQEALEVDAGIAGFRLALRIEFLGHPICHGRVLMKRYFSPG